MKTGIFIAIDGIDGSGKSEIVKMLHNHLYSKHKKYRILTTREPTHGKYGNKIREMLRKEKDPEVSSKKLAELFIKDREWHLKHTILPFLKSSGRHELNVVLCDRYYYSTIAFQEAQGMGIKLLLGSNRKFKKPDMALILDSEPLLALKRIAHRQKEKFEQLDFMKKVRENFLRLPRLMNDNIKIIDSNRPLSEVFESARQEVDKLLDY